MWQGLKRVAMLLGKKTLFPWKQHGKARDVGPRFMDSWGARFLCDAGFVRQHPHYRDWHAELAWPIIGLAILGLITGYIMNRYKKKRKILPLIHGTINVLLIILVAVECYTGVQVWKDFS